MGIETDWGGQLHKLPAAPQAIEPKPVVPALLPEYQVEGGVASLNETVDRTLFNPTRRPAPPATASAEGEQKVQSGQFVLTGTTLAGDRSIAFLKEVAGGKARTVRKGRQDQRHAGGRRAAGPGALHAGRRIRGIDAQGLAGPEDHGRGRAAGRRRPRRTGRSALPPPGARPQRPPPGAPPPAKASNRPPAPQTGRGARAAARAAAEAARQRAAPARQCRRRRATRRPMPGARSINACNAATRATK